MAKTKEELEEIKAEIDSLKETIGELSEEELDQVTGGTIKGAIDALGVGLPNVISAAFIVE